MMQRGDVESQGVEMSSSSAAAAAASSSAARANHVMEAEDKEDDDKYDDGSYSDGDRSDQGEESFYSDEEIAFDNDGVSGGGKMSAML